MSEDMQRDAIDCATQALEKYNIESDVGSILLYIKEEFDKKYYPAWHCIVGKDFRPCVTPDMERYICFHLGQEAILLFKCG
ncbi:unnamed protein product [Heligmosomoides polygyrus]|uniref:Dynein light chain n=1 Tax=Heligmosomoides polygyrus TaxID=6339 RepID=A0A183GEE7_HELPZ|nr:unnamed protein product [Heligmosomoides polygyrus]